MSWKPCFLSCKHQRTWPMWSCDQFTSNSCSKTLRQTASDHWFVDFFKLWLWFCRELRPSSPWNNASRLTHTPCTSRARRDSAHVSVASHLFHSTGDSASRPRNRPYITGFDSSHLLFLTIPPARGLSLPRSRRSTRQEWCRAPSLWCVLSLHSPVRLEQRSNPL